jgi:hypothetical protein
MKTLVPTVSIAGLSAVVAAAVMPQSMPEDPPPAPGDPVPVLGAEDPAAERRPVDLVICLDTSGSMTQLIDS